MVLNCSARHCLSMWNLPKWKLYFVGHTQGKISLGGYTLIGASCTPSKLRGRRNILELLMIINRPEFLVREYFLVVEKPNPLIHLHYFCGSTANLKVASNQPPCSKDLTVLYLALLILGSISAVSLVGLWFPPPPRRGEEEGRKSAGFFFFRNSDR